MCPAAAAEPPRRRRRPLPPARSPGPCPRPCSLTSAAVASLAVQGDAAGVGSVIKCGEEDDPIGVSTVLPLGRHGSTKPLQELSAFLLAAAGDHKRRLEEVRQRVGQ